MKKGIKNSLAWYMLELCVYAVLIVVYYFLVLHVLGDWLHRLFAHDRRIYAGVALALIVGQGVFLEAVTRLLLLLVKPRSERP
jgi:hypothetical protein